jgi:hypothetical protein
MAAKAKTVNLDVAINAITAVRCRQATSAIHG